MIHCYVAPKDNIIGAILTYILNDVFACSLEFKTIETEWTFNTSRTFLGLRSSLRYVPTGR